MRSLIQLSTVPSLIADQDPASHFNAESEPDLHFTVVPYRIKLTYFIVDQEPGH